MGKRFRSGDAMAMRPPLAANEPVRSYAPGSVERVELKAALADLSGTRIEAPAGAVLVQDLRVGMLVWTLDKTGVRVAQPVLQVSRTMVPSNHQVVHLVLDDGRQLWVSPGHPTSDGRRVGQLQAGDALDGARLLSADLVPYAAPATYDLLPAGDTGFYWANGILIASTLSDLQK